MKKHKGVIICPYRDREEHLKAFVPWYRKLVPHLDVVVVEQFDTRPFNRAKLLNIGFLEEGYKYDFAVYHDVDMLAQDDNGYEYYGYPVHLASAASQFNYACPYNEYFGGICNIPTEVMHAVNGFHNSFWGYAAEDDAMYKRLLCNFVAIHRIDNKRYESLHHTRNIDENLRQKNIQILNAPNDPTDGLSSCVYELISIEKKDGYTLIKAAL
jgi:glycosyl transferase family 7 (putative galactosyltransferase)